eukprot:12548590-Alexandrium_andersonii.AAC.1
MMSTKEVAAPARKLLRRSRGSRTTSPGVRSEETTPPCKPLFREAQVRGRSGFCERGLQKALVRVP